jgi:hypothetical protein
VARRTREQRETHASTLQAHLGAHHHLGSFVVHEAQDDYPTLAARTEDWRALMQQVDPVEKRIMARPPTSWTDVVELAEVAWWGIQHRGGDDRCSDHAAAVFTEAVLSLGGGEQFYLYEQRKPDRPGSPRTA